jgi:hypothetical protein
MLKRVLNGSGEQVGPQVGRGNACICRHVARAGAAVLLLGALVCGGSLPLRAEIIENNIAVFAALDQISANISHIEVPLGSTVRFGALKITPRSCHTRPPTEPPNTTAFVEVDEIKLNDSEERIFSGWMFAESPGIHGVEHPVFDVWLTSCKTM